MKKCYLESEFTSWWVLSQKIQPSQSSWEGKLAELWRTPWSFPEQYLSKLQSWGSFNLWVQACSGFPGGSDGKQSAHSRKPGFNPKVGKISRGGCGSPLQYSCLENPMNSRQEEPGGPWGCKESDKSK